MSSPGADLPPALLQQLEATLFRGGEAGPRDEAFERIASEHSEHAEAIRAWGRQVLGLGDGRLREPPPELPGYRAIEKLGEGGFGEVWRCEQTEPVRREVAVKLLKLGMDSAAILKRFAREQEAMARMSHDAIARIHDAGLSPRGQPFFVMELVDGAPITEWCEQRRSDLRDRLELFVEVCGGVQHAHQKGLVHRDLKPSNVLVTKVGQQAQPKLIDFGIARALESNDGSLQLTESGMMLGTPAYMAPEQACGDLAAIDTRTDVYALGAILFELLTGKPPHGDWLDAQASPWELRQRIVDGETPRPSATVLVAGRQETTWRRQLRGDLDWIVLKAMAKDPEHRYASAAELAADIERHQRLEPVLAGPPSRSYQLKKFLRRYRVQVGAAAAVLVTAVAGALVSWRWAREAEANAVRAVAEAGRAHSAEEAAKLESERAQQAEAASRTELARQERISTFLAGLFTRTDLNATGWRLRESLQAAMLRARQAALTDESQRKAAMDAFESVTGAVAFGEVAREMFAAEVLLPAVESARREFAADAVVLGRLLGKIGESFVVLDDEERARALAHEGWHLLGTELGEAHPEVLRRLAAYAVLEASDGGDARDALELATRGAEQAAASLGHDHPTTLMLLGAQASAAHRLGEMESAEALAREVLERRRQVLPATDSEVISAINNLASVLSTRGKVDEAVSLLNSIPVDSATPIGSVVIACNLAEILMRAQRVQDALALVDSRLPSAVASLGDGHAHTQQLLLRRAECLQAMDQSGEALKIIRQVLQRAREVHGTRSMPVAIAAQRLAAVAARQGDTATAVEASEEVLGILADLVPRHAPGVVATISNLAGLRERDGDLDAAEALYRDVLERVRSVDGHPNLPKATVNLAVCLCRRGNADEGLDLFLEGHRLHESLPIDHAERCMVAYDLARRLVEARPADALEFTSGYIAGLGGDSRVHRGMRAEFLVMHCKAAMTLHQFAAAEQDGDEASRLFEGLGAQGNVERRALATTMLELYGAWSKEPEAPTRSEQVKAWRALRNAR